MTLYEIIKNNAERGYHSIIQSKSDFKIVSPFKDYDGNYRDSAFKESLHECAQCIGCFAGWEKGAWESAEDRGVKYIGIYQPEPYKLFQPRDKVLVREDAEKWLEHYGMNNGNNLKSMFGMVREIKEVSTTDYIVWDADKSDYWYFPKEALEPYYETTPKVKEMTVAEISKALGFDVKVVK